VYDSRPAKRSSCPCLYRNKGLSIHNIKDIIRPFFDEERLQTGCGAPLDIADVQLQEWLVLIEVFGCDGNLDVSALLQFYFVTVLVG
jgi:hypothetical protein